MTNIEQDILNSEAALIDDHERLREALEAMTRRAARFEGALRVIAKGTKHTDLHYDSIARAALSDTPEVT